MATNSVYSKVFLAKIIVENDWGYHYEAIWYGSDAKNLALMVMDVMSSWYEPNKDQFGKAITNFHKKLEDATADLRDEKKKATKITFRELNGLMFNSNGLRLEIEHTNDLMEMYNFILGETFEFFANKGEKLEDFGSIKEIVTHLINKYEIDPPVKAAITTPNERTIPTALYTVDVKYQYTERHFINGSKEV